MLEKIKLLIVDDSAFMRKAIQMMVEDAADIEVVGMVKNGQEAIDFIKKNKVDLVTMDIEMPIMDGISALKIITKECPLPVIMVSSLTTEDADATLEALSIGAVDFIPKQMSFVSLEIVNIKQDLLAKIRYFYKNKSRILTKSRSSSLKSISNFKGDTFSKHTVNKNIINRHSQSISKDSIDVPKKAEIVVIGSSTGGPSALQKVIPDLPANFPLPILIAQHIPASFTKSLADRLNKLSKIKVKEAEDGEKIKKGYVYIAPGGTHMHLSNKKVIKISPEPKEAIYKPSVDVIMHSVAKYYKDKCIAVIMTGMGNDGTEALKSLHELGAFIIGQDESSCVVYGMPKKPNENKYSNLVVDLKDIAVSIVKNM